MLDAIMLHLSTHDWKVESPGLQTSDVQGNLVLCYLCYPSEGLATAPSFVSNWITVVQLVKWTMIANNGVTLSEYTVWFCFALCFDFDLLMLVWTIKFSDKELFIWTEVELQQMIMESSNNDLFDLLINLVYNKASMFSHFVDWKQINDQLFW